MFPSQFFKLNLYFVFVKNILDSFKKRENNEEKSIKNFVKKARERPHRYLTVLQRPSPFYTVYHCF